MEINQLKEGDILLFSPEKGSFISWAITFLTNAPVSHAAIYYNGNKELLVEESPPQVRSADVKERFKGRNISVMRHYENLDMNPVINAASSYLNSDEPYDDVGLYMVGLLLIYKKFSINNLKQKIIIKILKKITAKITKLILEHKYPDKNPMVCSQFAAQCYEDAGNKYKLILENQILKLSESEKEKSLLELVTEQNEKINLKVEGLALENLVEEPLESGEELCKKLHDAFIEENPENGTFEISNELYEAVNNFTYVNKTIIKSNENALKLSIDQSNMFITPGDLLYNCKNLKKIGEIK